MIVLAYLSVCNDTPARHRAECHDVRALRKIVDLYIGCIAMVVFTSVSFLRI